MSLLRRETNWLTVLPILAAQFSTCSKRQYAAIVLQTSGRVIGFGYNGSPPGLGHCVDGYCPRTKMDSPSGSVYDNCIAQHAEANALLWTDPAQRTGATLIVNGPPCFGCAKQIASSGVGRVVCFSDDSYKDWPFVRDFFFAAKIEIVEVDPHSVLV
jgi:dCMP deaminase